MAPRILLGPCRTELIEKHSRFIGIGYPCQSLESFKQHKAELEAAYPDATHITYAYKIQDQNQLHIRFSDDGEPAGTAGKPILMHIEGQGLSNVALFVVRYYGGIKLGAGGLVRAYGNTAKQLLSEAHVADYIPKAILSLRLPYHEQHHLDYLVKKHEAIILNREFGADLLYQIELPEAQKDIFLGSLGSHYLVND